ncbi:hypothetical protein BGZ81_003752 [Podila clonocystis]|nr:hypothetical protein BGZ81_003752 [Podila clonocystis]
MVCAYFTAIAAAHCNITHSPKLKHASNESYKNPYNASVAINSKLNKLYWIGSKTMRLSIANSSNKRSLNG